MRFSCDGCGAQYMISDDKVGPNGVKVRCKKCGNVVSVKRAPSVAPEIAPAPPSPAPEARGEASGESTLERELGNAFDSVFGGGSVGLPGDGDEPAAHANHANGSLVPSVDEGTAASPAEETAPTGASAPEAEKPSATAEEIVDWYVAVDERQVGPLQATAVKARWESGEIGPDTLAWRPGMADWVPLSTIAEMAQYLAPVPHGGSGKPAASSAPAAELRVETSSPTPAPIDAAETPAAPASPSISNGVSKGALNGHDTSWKPSAASALAALANEEIASLQKPEPKKEEPAPAAQGGGSLLEQMELPDGGVDPTNVLPLPIKGLEPTGEAALPKKPAPSAPETTDLRRIKKSATRSVLAIGVTMAVLFAVGIAIVIWKLQPGREARPAPVAQAPAAAIAAPAAVPKPAPPAAEPVKVPPASASAPSIPGTPGPVPVAAPPPGQPAPAAPAVAAAAAPASAPRPAAEPPASQAPQHAAPAPPNVVPHRAAAAPEPPAPVASRTHRIAKEEPPQRAMKKGQRLASAERAAPPPAPVEQPRRKSGGDPLLDVGGDDEVEKELSGKGTKRSVYVPPAMGSDLPENVSVSQINEAVVGQKSALMRCIDQQKAADPDTRGTLKVRWIIAGDGSVRDVRLLNNEFARQPIAPCITSIVRGIRFPRSRTTGQEVVFPFKF